MDQLQLFTDLKVKAARPCEPIARQALVVDGCRYWLKRAWGAGEHICWAMCNPSTADAAKDDPTLLRVMEFSASWGFGSCTVINPIPFISSTPAAAIAWAKRAQSDWLMDGDWNACERSEWRENVHHCARALDGARTHVVAWGNNMPDDVLRNWLQDIAEAADDGRGGGAFEDDPPPIEWKCIGITAGGAPKHPLARGRHRVPIGAQLQRWKP